MSTAIIDYDAGNLTSVQRACAFCGTEAVITSNPAEIAKARRVIFPGVGHAARAVRVLRERGLDTALDQAWKEKKPVLGICLGTQIILSYSEEGDTTCLDIIAGECRRFVASDPAMKIPQIGWNGVYDLRAHPLLEGVSPDDEFYFVHSYYPVPSQQRDVMARCEYGGIEFAAAIGHENLFATQFHPEKSGKIGLRILRNFLEWDGCVC